MRRPDPSAAIEALEERLGDPADPHQALSFARCLELDERDAYPEAASDAIDRAGVPDYYVPVSEGGRLGGFQELAGVLRAVARRDLTLAIAHHITMAGAVHVWTAGSDDQKRTIASYLRAGGRMAVAYHERAHGSDLLSTDTAAAVRHDGYVLDGEKWFVNSATRAPIHTVFARTRPAGGPRGFSLFLVDTRRLRTGSVEHLPRLLTLGARGADFSGVRFCGAELPADALVGRLGEGLELTLRSFQVTRTLIPAMSLGAADTALRTVVAFSKRRVLSARAVFAIPRPRALLAAAFADLLACDCVVTAAARALHLATSQMRLWSAVCKAFVPATVHRMLDVLGEILGARSFLRADPEFGHYQKIVRDHRAVPIFHAGGFLMLQTVAMALLQMSAPGSRPEGGAESDRHESMRSVFALGLPLPPFDWTALRPYARLRDPLVGFGRFLDRREGGPGEEGAVDAHVVAAVDSLVRCLEDVRRRDQAALDEVRRRSDFEAPELFELAERYCVLCAADACLRTWANSRRNLDPLVGGGNWLVVSLSRMLDRLNAPQPVPPAFTEGLARSLERLYLEHRSFSILPVGLPGRPPLEPPAA